MARLRDILKFKSYASIIKTPLIAVIYFFAAKSGLFLAFENTNATPVWPPTGIALAAVLLLGHRIWPGIFAGAFLANIGTLSGLGLGPFSSAAAAFSTAAGNTLEAVAGSALIRLFAKNKDVLANIRDTVKLTVLGGLVSTAISATIGVITLCLATSNWSAWPQVWITWWLGDATGAILIAPLVLAAASWNPEKWKPVKTAEAFAAFALLASVAFLVFNRGYEAEYLIIPILLWIAFRFGTFETCLALVLLSGIAVLSTARGEGPFAGKTLNESLLHLQSYIGVVAAAALFFSVVMRQQRIYASALKKEKAFAEIIIDSVPGAFYVIDADGRLVRWNRYLAKLNDLSGDELRGMDSLRNIHNEDKDIIASSVRDAFKTGEAEAEARIKTREGERCFLFTGRRIDAGGQPLVVGSGIEITSRKQAEQKAARISRLYSVLSKINEVIVRTRDLASLYEQVCRIAVEHGHLHMVWIGLVDPDTLLVNPAAIAGYEEGYLSGKRFSVDKQTPEGRGPTGTAIREGGYFVCNDIEHDPRMIPWREEALKRGYRSSAAFSLRARSEIVGTINLYADKPFFFEKEEEILLLKSLADDVSFAIESIQDIAERKRAEEELLRYKDQLEELVKVRTATLQEMNAKLQREIEERARVEKALAASETKYRDIVESANSVILRWTPEGKITFFNTFAQNFFGYPGDEIIGRNISGTIVPIEDSNGHDMSSLAHDIAERPEVYAINENENIRKNKERVWVTWTNRPIRDDEGNVVEILSIGVDSTKRVKAEKELRLVLDDLAVAKERAEAADRLKSAFLATMSHELRTPLNSIIGFTGILRQGLAGPLNDEQRKQLEMVQNSADHLLSLINDVLDISKIEAGQLQVASTSFDLKASLMKVVQTVRPLAQKKGLDLTLSIDADDRAS